MSSIEKPRDLVPRLRAGDTSAYRELMQLYERRLYAFANRILRDSDDAMDVVQDTFIRVFKSVGSFQGDAAFTSWIFRITRNLCIDRLRRKKRVQMTEFNDALKANPNALDKPSLTGQASFQTPDNQSLSRELGDQMLEALKVLSESHREILLLRELEGLSYGEISEILGVPSGTVMSRLFHARKKMQKALSPYVGSNLEVGSNES